MRPIDDPSSLTPNERLSDVAEILAAGILRLRTRAALLATDPPPENLPNSGFTCLELAADPALSVHTG